MTKLERSIRSAMGAPRAGALAATVAAAILASSATWTAALAQQPPLAQQRDEAPIGHRQPRIQDLPPGQVQDKKNVETELDAIAKDLEKLENRICRGC
jgi:hypothetical protein